MSRIAVLLAVLASASPAAALDCRSATNQTELNLCAEQTFQAADAALNEVYRAVTARLAKADAPDARALLVTSQRAWLGFRDAECAFRTVDSEGGSMHGMDVRDCQTALTKERTGTLKAYLSCKAEDSDCPAAVP